jgi:hypothetical protein
MKKLIVLAVAVGLLVAAGCSTDKNKGGIAEEYGTYNPNPPPMNQGLP